MRHLPHILILVIMAFLGSSCQEASLPSVQDAQSFEYIQAESQTLHLFNNRNRILYSDGIFSHPISLFRTVYHSEKRAETRYGGRREPTSRGGGKDFKACRAPRSTIYLSIGRFVQRHSVSICPLASHISLIYVLRHIIR